MISETLLSIARKDSLIVAFVVVGIVIWFSYFLSRIVSNGRLHGSAIAIAIRSTLEKRFVGIAYHLI